MSAKSVIQKLEDCDLIRLFLQFVQTHHLQYEKTSKEISYKCYEATWILINFKANGYGRTQSQAYKHALRNLLEILIQQPPYTQFFANTLAALQNPNNRPSIKKQPLAESVSTQNQSKKIISSKTEGHEPIEKENKRKGESYSKLYESYSKINQKSQSKFGTTKGWQTPSVKMIESTGVYNTTQVQNPIIKKVNQSTNKLASGYTTKIERPNNESNSQELRKAYKKLSDLEQYLASVLKENEMLKRQLKQTSHTRTVQEKENIYMCSSHQETHKTQFSNNENQISIFLKNKPQVPRLKLDILPNYHKKSEKPLNDSLLAAYNEKKQQSVKKIVC